MLRSILTPLRARFDPTSPRPGYEDSSYLRTPVNDDFAPEDFAKDVLVELMRNSVESLKIAEGMKAKTEVMAEIQRIMLQDACTKDVFREMDGFLVLMSVLSTVQAICETGGDTAPEAITEALECADLSFALTSEAIHDHSANSAYFAERVGYDALFQAVQRLASLPQTAETALGLLLSLALHNFSDAVSWTFQGLRQATYEAIDAKLAHTHDDESDSELGERKIEQAGGIQVLWMISLDVYQDRPEWGMLRYAIYKVFEQLAHSTHRNQVVFGSLGMVGILVEQVLKAAVAGAGEALSLVPDVEVGDEKGHGKDKERHVQQKLLRRVLDMGASTADARTIFKRVVKEGEEKLDGDVLEIIRTGVKSRWPDHFSMEAPRAALVLEEDGLRGLPITGFTYMAWLWIEKMPRSVAYTLFSFNIGAKFILKLGLRSDGRLQLRTTGNRDPAIFAKVPLQKSRWVHVTLVHYPHRVSNPTIRLFIDGVLSDAVGWAYPKIEGIAQTGVYTIGDMSPNSEMSWSMASSYLLSIPLGDDLPRLIHHLGPRYVGAFQDARLVRFLTYEASTSLNMFLAALSTKVSPTSPAADLSQSPLVRAVKDGLGITESSIVFAVCPGMIQAGAAERNATRPLSPIPSTPSSAFLFSSQAYNVQTVRRREWEVKGDVVVAFVKSLDVAMWKIGGAAVALRLVQLASTPHELSRTLGILTDGLRNNWQNSEDMERLHGYDILANILRTKSNMINMTGFETLFEFLGLNFRSPDQSTIVNAVAYRAIALDFELWARTRKEIQRVHLEHFTTLLQTSRFTKFNIKQRISKLGLVRKLLFALQTEWYQHDTIPLVVVAIKVAAESNWSADEAIKPLISYLAANLHEVAAGSPQSIISRIDTGHHREKAEQVLESLISILSHPVLYTKFTSTLPLTRICILLLGEHPTPAVAAHVLNLIAMSLNASPSFSRKFELVSGWSILRIVLPSSWDPGVHEAIFDILLGRRYNSQVAMTQSANIACPYVVPIIFAALYQGLQAVVFRGQSLGEQEADPMGASSFMAEPNMEVLIEELIDLHASSSTFRQVFRSQQTTQLFVDGYKAFVNALASISGCNRRTTRILEKISHFGLTLVMDNDVSAPQKREILNISQSAQSIYDPESSQTPLIESELVLKHKKSASGRVRMQPQLSIQVGERTTQKSMSRMHEWRTSIIATERKRLRKTVLDLREHHRQILRLNDWSQVLMSERGLWAHLSHTKAWRLDSTEGPYRVRKKLEAQDEEPSSRIVVVEQTRDVNQPDADTQSIFQVEVPPWAESYEISATDVNEDRQLTEEVADDKHRRVRHDLEPGDVIEAVSTVARIDGVDSSPGLLIFGRTHLYMLDGLVENDDGEVMDAHDAPRKLFFVPGSTVELNGPQRAQRWAYDQVASFSDRTFLFRDVALEVYFKDSRSLLIVLLDKKRRSETDQRLTAIIGHRGASDAVTPGTGLLKTPLFGKMSARVLAGFKGDELSSSQRKWQAREISNFTYLSIINQISGRTPSDATQYPIFPWVLKDYISETIDLTSAEPYRDLTKPMGALTDARSEAAHTRYTNLESVDEKPFHYGTHFSSSMIVCHFLIRLPPFTNMFKTLQKYREEIGIYLTGSLAIWRELTTLHQRTLEAMCANLFLSFTHAPSFWKMQPTSTLVFSKIQGREFIT